MEKENMNTQNKKYNLAFVAALGLFVAVIAMVFVARFVVYDHLEGDGVTDSSKISNQPIAPQLASEEELEWRKKIEQSYGDKNQLPEVIESTYDYPKEEAAQADSNQASPKP